MKLRFSIYSILFLAGVMMSSCGGNKTRQDSAVAEDAHEEHVEGVVELTEQQAKAIGLRLGKIQMRNLKAVVRATGELELPPQDMATVTPYIGGVVKSVKVMEGDEVRKGQVLAYLAQAEYIHVQHQYLENYNKLQFLKKEYERKKKLYDERITSGKEFQNITSEYKSVEAVVKSFGTKLELLGLSPQKVRNGKISQMVPITSPISGHVTKVNVNTGTFAETQVGMFEIVNNSNLYLDLSIYENDIAKVKKGQAIRFTVANMTGKEYGGELYAVSKAFEGNSKSVKAFGKITEGDTEPLISGLFVNATISVGDENVPAVPEGAIALEGDETFVFVRMEADGHSHGSENVSEGHGHDHGNEVSHDHEDAGHEGHDHGKETHDHKAGEAHDHVEAESVYIFKRVPVVLGAKSGGYVEIKPLEEIPINSELALNGAYYLSAEMGKAETSHSH
ncbi:hypothetical protein FUAX_24740 [Fulvitalea axinellae]|uniref:CzcB-like barrel-sandwich hybrid domain-containing protein n=1 Tax=Fulvitalea axinellae TaxID=1182444 RepID=A0AAU9CX88_9BACT|nr:hypothetical protein FUAX_24740 [Fulvitalea axinellae]